MTEEEILKKIRESKSVLVYFSQPACNVCKTLRPKIEDLVSGYPDIDFQYVDTQSCILLRGQYLIFAVPTIVLFNQGTEVRRWSRYVSVQEVDLELSRYQSRLTDQ